ncbi:MAG: YceI family protein [Candidatus Dormibacteraeota bacterium]|nr:YceI family protein [Candidatus Dormibacteraeota bacterium]
MAIERFEIDPAHTNVGFSAKHMAITTVRGHFGEVTGWFEADRSDPSTLKGEVTIKVESITTNQPQRDGHLRSPDFFDAATYPSLVFRPTSAEKRGEDTYTVTGDLTIRDVTKPITLQVSFEGEAADFQNPDAKRVGVEATGQLDRMEYGLNWDGLAGAIPLAGHTIKLQVEAELIATTLAARA